jgi:hypothetical protein
MPVHLTPEELAEATGMDARQVMRLCQRHAVPVYQGRIDKTLFVRSVTAGGKRLPEAAAPLVAEVHAP